MCLSAAYVIDNGKKEEVLNDVAFLKAEGNGFRLTTLLGDNKFVEGRIESIDFMNEHSVVFVK
jgi:predicted RNA-binding protein